MTYNYGGLHNRDVIVNKANEFETQVSLPYLTRVIDGKVVIQCRQSQSSVIFTSQSQLWLAGPICFVMLGNHWVALPFIIELAE